MFLIKLTANRPIIKKTKAVKVTIFVPFRSLISPNTTGDVMEPIKCNAIIAP